MQGMFNELKAKGTSLAVKRSIYGFTGALLLLILFELNVFGLGDDAIIRYRPYVLIMVALATAASISSWVRASRNNLMRGIEKFCKGSDIMLSRMEKAWNDGYDFGEGRMDAEFIISLKGFRSKVIPLEGVVWVSKRLHNVAQGGGSLEVVLVDFEYKYSKSLQINFDMKENAADNILRYLMENRPDIAVDREAVRNLSKPTEAARLYANKDWDGLLEYARAQRRVVI